MSHSEPHKKSAVPAPVAPAAKSAPAPKPAPAAKAFGIELSDSPHAKAGGREWTPKQKKMAGLGVLLVTLGAIAWWMNRPGDAPSESAKVVESIRKAEQAKDQGRLVQVIQGTDPVATTYAMRSLVNVAGADAVQPYLADRRVDVRAAAVTSLGETRDIAQIPVIEKYITDPSPDVRVAAVRSLYEMRDFRIFDSLLTALMDEDESIRTGAIQAIEEKAGLKFDFYKANAGAGTRGQAVARIRQRLAQPQFRTNFDAYTEALKKSGPRTK